ncbi:MAG: type I 3-dehydroquinate dehydratase [Treponema sp.]|nr:type I 3-dehydroquinate dehydratase [Treponema sp.]MCL2272824.1 type I 3-dehydroquinate dehydratase [Treponema sp.]
MAKICLCLTAKTLDRNLEILNKYRKFTDIAELRVDCLDDDERLYIRRFPELAGMPVILTIRRDTDGGQFVGGEGARVKLLARGLAFAKADTRLNFAYVDIEEDFSVPSLEEAARTFGTRIIRSYHDMNGIIENIPGKIKSMQRSGDEIVKIAVSVKSTADILQVMKASKSCPNTDKILICMGHYGICSRILAERFGSFLSYASALSEQESPGAPGQLDVKEIAELYRFRRISKKTRVYGIIGNPLKSSVSPWFFNTVFGLENADAVYVPFPTDSVSNFFELANELEIKGFSVTVPHKESVLYELARCTETVLSISACNTVSFTENGWFGENTDCTGFSDSILAFLGRKDLKRKKITIIGAGGVARAVAVAVYRLGGKVLILNRTINKAKNIASQYKFRWGGLDNQGIEMMSKYNDIVIQTTTAGMEGNDDTDPLDLYNFSGKEAVMDLIYIPGKTHFLKRAEEAGCKIINGYDTVIRQACTQYASFFGREIPHQLLSQVNTPGAYTWNKI